MGSAAGTDQPNTQVRNAAAFGWALTELLGRAYALTEEPLPEHIDWAQPGLTLLPTAEGRPPREGLRAVMTQVSFLADQLGVGAQVIPHPIPPRPDPSGNPSYVAVLTDAVTRLSQTADAHEVGQLQRTINERLFFWDMQIQDALQQQAIAVPTAYLVGRSLASLRWHYASGGPAAVLGEKSTNGAERLDGLRRRVERLGPSLPSFATVAISNSLVAWAPRLMELASHQKRSVPLALDRQTAIWHDLITGARDPLTYVSPAAAAGAGWRYAGKVLQASWPIFALAIAVAAAILSISLWAINSYITSPLAREIAAGVGGAFAFLTLAGTSLGAVNGVWQKGVVDLAGPIWSSATSALWTTAQQEAVNKATFVPPAS